ncbi:hypothetical protein AVEN_234041-1 [Araneus ventricosus]|uniref:Uncharacterized protein n=1 Tax=Araneus ventricosus TaxID=182803 RepID=A0A4Y2FK07_ARAVE|nr:hypothetical protein AVEN_234041-1 [Araneus ventricosus]
MFTRPILLNATRLRDYTVRDTALHVHLHSAINLKHAPSYAKLDNLLFVMIWRNPSCNRRKLSRNEDTDAGTLTTQVQLGIPPRHLSASTLTPGILPTPIQLWSPFSF